MAKPKRIYQDCLADAVAAKKITKKTAKLLTKHFEDAEKEAIQNGASEIAAYAFAATRGAERMMAQVGLSKANAARSIMKIETNWQNANAHKSGLFEGLVNVLGENRKYGVAEPGLVATQKGVYATMQSRLTGMIEALRSKNWGTTRDVAHAFDMVKELFNEPSGNPAAKVNAEAFRKVLDDYWIPRFADEGVKVAKRDDWVFVQKFNPTKLQAMKQEGFTGTMLEGLDLGMVKLRDFESTAPNAWLDHTKPDDLARIKRILGGDDEYAGSYRNIISNGAAGLEPGATVKDTLLTKYNKQRVFEFQGSKGYEWFLENFGFGKRNLGEQFLTHVKRISDDLGTAMVLGVDPDKAKDILVDMARKAELSKGDVGYLERSYFRASGKGNVAENVITANMMSAGRSLMSGVLLPKAILGSASDFAFMGLANIWNGLPFTNALRLYLGGLDRTDAMLHGAIWQTGIRGARDHFDGHITQNMGSLGMKGLTVSQWGEAASAGLSRMMGGFAETIMRGTALEWHSTQGRFATTMNLLGTLRKNADLEWGALPPGLRFGMENYGIDAPRWDLLRTKGVQPTDVALNPAILAYEGANKFERSAGLRLLAQMEGEAHAAIPEGGVAVAATRLGSTTPGTVPGELARIVQFKGFAQNVWQTHFQRAYDNIAGKTGSMPRGTYGAFLVVATTLMGAASVQLQNIAAGKDPEDMTTKMFWLKALAMGGAGGMMSDWLRTAFQASQSGEYSRLLPPLAAFAYDTAAVPLGDIGQLAQGKKTGAGREASNWARRYLPSLWYTRLIQDRLVYDNLQMWLDPNAAQSFRNIQQREYRERGTEFYAPPGQGFMRAPISPLQSAAVSEDVMTVTTTANSISYAGNGVTKAFAFPFIFFAPSDLVVRLIIAATSTDVVPAPVLNGAATYDYTVTGFFADGEYASGGTVTFNTAPITGYTVSLVRAVPATQLVTLIDNAKFPATTINNEFDKLTVLAQQSAAISSVLPGGPAGGDLAGSYPNPTIKTSVALIGTPTAPTPALGDNDTSIATTAFVTATIAATPPSGIGFRLLGRTVVSSAVADVNVQAIPSDINDLMFTFDLSPTTTAQDLILQFYDSGGVVIAAGYVGAVTAATHTQAIASAPAVAASANTAISTGICFNYSVAGRRVGAALGIRGTGTVPNIKATTRSKGCDFQSNYLSDDATVYMNCTGNGTRTAGGAITGMRLLFGTGTIASGAFSVWGSP